MEKQVRETGRFTVAVTDTAFEPLTGSPLALLPLQTSLRAKAAAGDARVAALVGMERPFVSAAEPQRP